jgi:hypothetical protein
MREGAHDSRWEAAAAGTGVEDLGLGVLCFLKKLFHYFVCSIHAPVQKGMRQCSKQGTTAKSLRATYFSVRV